MNVLNSVRDTISRYNMIPMGSKVIVCLSGGADSVCLLNVLRELSGELDISLSAVHVNHCLRGEESDRDMRFCEQLCERLDIHLTVVHVNVKGYCAQYGVSCEEGARKLRYHSFQEEALNLGGALIATAHNKDDSSETVIFNLARGTGLKGLCGIPRKRDNIIRPLIGVTRSDIEAYLRELGQEYVTDSTNLTEDYSRNIIRHRIIPVLREINGNLHESVSRLSESAGEDEEYFEELLRNIPEDEIYKYPPSVRKRYIRKMLTRAGAECSFERLNILDGMMTSCKNVKYDLKGSLFAVFSNGTMEIRELVKQEKLQFNKIADFANEGEIIIPEFDKTVIIRRPCSDIFQCKDNIQKKLTNNFVNCDKIQGVAALRNKQDGDKLRFNNHGVTTKLKKLFSSMKLSEKERSSALVIEDESGVIWCEYGGAAERVAPRQGDDPRNIFEIIVRKTAENDYRSNK